MRHYIEKTEPARTITVHDKTTCDLCGKAALRGDWERSYYEVNDTEIEVKIRQKDGVSYPEGGYGTEYEIDMCPECFKTKLIPWLESQGCTAKRKEWEREW